jgi:hypothetical protein
MHFEMRENMREREIVIRLRLPSTRRGRWVLAGVVGGLLMGVVAYASVPITFTQHTLLQAADLNSNFTSLDNRLTTVEGKVGFGVAYGFCSTNPGTGVPCDGGITCPGHVYAGGCKSDHGAAIIASYPNANDGTQKKWLCLYTGTNDTGDVWALCGP